jgi:hypothetical protein
MGGPWSGAALDVGEAELSALAAVDESGELRVVGGR